MLDLHDAWTWDFWLADTGNEYHAFFLRASRALSNPDARHFRASIGHAVSKDLRRWKLLPDALVRSERPGFDDIATWTGSVIQGPNGEWHTFYTGISTEESGLIQRIGMATSNDLVRWERRTDFTVLSADSRWYEKLGQSSWGNEAWRDPYVFADPNHNGWHMFVTARAQVGIDDDRGVIGHLHSDNLIDWTTLPPLSLPGAGFGAVEVPHMAVIDGKAVLLFSCGPSDLAASKTNSGERGGIWALVTDNPLGPFDLTQAYVLTNPTLYAGRLTTDRLGNPVLLAFRNYDKSGTFVGGMNDPLPLKWNREGHLVLAAHSRTFGPSNTRQGIPA